MGGLSGGEIFKPKPYFQGGWENIIKYMISELLDKAFKLSFKISK